MAASHEKIEIGVSDLDSVLSMCVLTGVVISVDVDNDTADVEISGVGRVNDVPIFYHCAGESTTAGGSLAFAEDDEVLILNKRGEQLYNETTLKIVGFVEKLKPCSVDFLYVALTSTGKIGRCFVWDIKEGELAVNIPKNGGGVATFPCDPAVISEWVAVTTATGSALFTTATCGIPQVDQPSTPCPPPNEPTCPHPQYEGYAVVCENTDSWPSSCPATNGSSLQDTWHEERDMSCYITPPPPVFGTIHQLDWWEQTFVIEGVYRQASLPLNWLKGFMGSNRLVSCNLEEEVVSSYRTRETFVATHDEHCVYNPNGGGKTDVAATTFEVITPLGILGTPELFTNTRDADCFDTSILVTYERILRPGYGSPEDVLRAVMTYSDRSIVQLYFYQFIKSKQEQFVPGGPLIVTERTRFTWIQAQATSFPDTEAVDPRFLSRSYSLEAEISSLVNLYFSLNGLPDDALVPSPVFQIRRRT